MTCRGPGGSSTFEWAILPLESARTPILKPGGRKGDLRGSVDEEKKVQNIRMNHQVRLLASDLKIENAMRL